MNYNVTIDRGYAATRGWLTVAVDAITEKEAINIVRQSTIIEDFEDAGGEWHEYDVDPTDTVYSAERVDQEGDADATLLPDGTMEENQSNRHPRS